MKKLTLYEIERRAAAIRHERRMRPLIDEAKRRLDAETAKWQAQRARGQERAAKRRNGGKFALENPHV